MSGRLYTLSDDEICCLWYDDIINEIDHVKYFLWARELNSELGDALVYDKCKDKTTMQSERREPRLQSIAAVVVYLIALFMVTKR